MDSCWLIFGGLAGYWLAKVTPTRLPTGYDHQWRHPGWGCTCKYCAIRKARWERFKSAHIDSSGGSGGA